MIRAPQSPEPRAAPLDMWTALAVAAGLGLNGLAVHSVPLTVVVAMATLPVWLGVALLDRWFTVVFVVGLVAIATGWMLSMASLTTHNRSMHNAVAQSMVLLAVSVGAGALAWAIAVLGRAPALLSYGCGLLVNAVLKGVDVGGNPWKYRLSIPVTIIVLAAAWWVGRTWIQLVALLALATVSGLFDARSAASMVLIAGVVMSWQWVRNELNIRSTALRTLLAVVALGLICYNALRAFILQGWLGQEAALRTEAQIQAAGSLLAGGRPEMGAAIALVRAYPQGIGVGIIPNFSDIYVAKTGMKALQYSPDNGYVERYMFGSGFEVHSVIGDLWLRFGIVGAAFGVLTTAVVGWRMVRALVANAASALWVVLAVQVLWNLLFGPLHLDSLSVLVAALGLGAHDSHKLPERWSSSPPPPREVGLRAGPPRRLAVAGAFEDQAIVCGTADRGRVIHQPAASAIPGVWKEK